MGEIRRLFVPFGELKPDGKLFNNDGMIRATNVVPVCGDYVASQLWVQSGDEPADEAYGLHAHFQGGSTWLAYLGSITKLYEYTSSFVKTDKSRAAGGAYATPTGGEAPGWQFASFGDAVIATQYADDPQLLTSPAAAKFVKLAQSGSGNPGMDPKAKFVAPVRGNLFLANLNLAAGFDTLPSGANPTVACWSQSDNVRQYGSFNKTPELVGTGYQPLSYDLGHINGMIGGEYALISLQRGWVRVDGPPYTFRPIVEGQGCRHPNSIVRFDDDVYFWGPSGPSVLRGGEGPVEVLGTNKISRSLIDNATGFSPYYAASPSNLVRHVSAGRDAANALLFWGFTSIMADTPGQQGDLSIVYNINDQRFSFVENSPASVGATGPFDAGVLFLQEVPDLGGTWAPGRDLLGVMHWLDDTTAEHWKLARPSYAGAGSASPLLERAFQQIDPEFTTRIRRVRPIFSITDATAYQLSVSITSKNKPYDAAATTTFTEQDGHGWISTPSTVFADFHQVRVNWQLSLPTIAEMEGYELEYEVGGAYSA